MVRAFMPHSMKSRKQRSRNTQKTKRHKRHKRHTKHVRRTRGGMEDLHKMIYELFPEFDASRISITESDDSYQVRIMKCEEQARHSQKYSPRITIFKNGRMYIGRLTSCKPVSGAEIVRRYIQLAQRLGLQSIYLDDVSEIYFPRSRYGDDRCAIDLAILRILQKGQSWYESLGFVSSISKEDREENERVRHMSIGELIQRLIEKEKEDAKNRIMKRYELNNNTSKRNKELSNAKERKSKLEDTFSVFSELDSSTPVHQAIQHMIDRINSTDNACESDSFRILQQLIKACILTKQPVIHYEPDNLRLTL